MVARDVTDRHRLDFDQGDTGVLRAVMANMHGMVVLVDGKGLIRSINGAVTRLLGYDPELIRGRSIFDYLHPEDRDHVLDTVRAVPPHGSITLDARLLMADYTAGRGDHLRVHRQQPARRSGGAQLRDQRPDRHRARRRPQPRELPRRARQPHRAAEPRRVHAQRRRADPQGGGLGILIVDIVHFRSINELYGEPTGDAVLSAIADRIDKIRWPDLITARFGGDEFVLAVRASSQSAVEMLRERVRRDVSQPFIVGDHEVNFRIRTASSFDAQPEVLDSLLVSASNELMAAKRFAEAETTGISVDAINERRRQLDQLRHALANGEIQPFYQPIVDPTGKIIAVEALVRWVHPMRGVLGVNEILPLAQMAGLAEAVDDCVLDAALDFAVRLAEAGHGDTEVHINIDPKVIAQPAFGVSFLERCRRAGANPTSSSSRSPRPTCSPGRVVAGQHAEAALRRHPRVDRRLRHRLLEPRPPARTSRRRREDRPPVRGRDRHRSRRDEPDHGDHRAQREPAARVRRRGRRAAVPARSADRARLFSVPGLAVLGGGRAGRDARDDAAHRAGRPRSDVPARPAVVDVPQHEPVRWGDPPAAERSSAASVRDDAARPAAPADVDERADDAADHLVAERRGGDLEAGDAPSRVVDEAPPRRREPADEARRQARRAASGRRQNDEKSCSPSSTAAASFIAPRSSGCGTCHAVRARSGFGSGSFQTS